MSTEVHIGVSVKLAPRATSMQGLAGGGRAYEQGVVRSVVICQVSSSRCRCLSYQWCSDAVFCMHLITLQWYSPVPVLFLGPPRSED